MSYRTRLRYVVAGLLMAAALVALSGIGYASSRVSASVAQYQPNKVTICHHTKGKKGTHHVTITVSRSAVPAHLKHGDTVGPCATPKSIRVHSSAAHVKKFHPKTTLKQERAKQKGKGKGKGK